MTTIPLTPAQHAILAHAIEHTAGKIEWFPDNIKGGARTKVLEGLFNKSLITRDSTDWFVAAEGYDALGRARPLPAPSGCCELASLTAACAEPITPDTEIEAAVTAAEAEWAQEKQVAEGKPRTRENSKQAQVISMLRRPEGATIQQICEATKWQKHTVRGTFAGAFKKKLGLQLTSEKPEGSSERIYRVG